MPTITDVAERAGVSITTVSHVINETRFVSDELRERVCEAMRELNYSPNTLASSLRSGRTKTIGLIVPDISNPFFAEIARKIEDKGLDYGYSVILCNSDDEKIKEKNYIDILIAKQADGLIFISAGEISDNLKKPIESIIPIVIADRDIENSNFDVVLVDNYRGGYEATKYLISKGHTRIGCISGPSLVTPSTQRVEGYKEALGDANLSIDSSMIEMGDFRYQSGEAAMNKFMANTNPPTAVFACNDMMAIGAIRALNDRGKRVPEDISIIGFDNIPLSHMVYPALTTIAQPVKQMADLIVDLLVEKIQLKQRQKRNQEEQPKYKRIVLKTNLIERDSCRSI